MTQEDKYTFNEFLSNLKHLSFKNPWAISWLLFMAVFISSIKTIFMPFKNVIETADETTILINGAGSYVGLQQMGKSWVENPHYFIGIGAMGLISLIGAFWSLYFLTRKRKVEAD